MTKTTNIKIVGIGGQGVLRTSLVLSDALCRAGYDVKQSEVHGMSQRGGSVVSEIRFGEEVHSPLTPAGQVDFLLGLNHQEVERSRADIRPASGLALEPPDGVKAELDDPRAVNMVLVGQVSRLLDIDRSIWEEAIRASMPRRAVEGSLKAFDLGRGKMGT